MLASTKVCFAQLPCLEDQRSFEEESFVVMAVGAFLRLLARRLAGAGSDLFLLSSLVALRKAEMSMHVAGLDLKSWVPGTEYF